MANLSLNYDERFRKKIRNFPDTLYRVNDPTSKIHRLLYALLEIGVGQAKGMQDIALIAQNSLAATTGQELDQYFEMFGIRRTPEFSKGITNPAVNDSKFRVAISKFLQAVSLGGTAEGIRLMAEASTSFKCHVIEPWRNPEYWIDNPSETKPRLLDSENKPIGNEVVIFVYPNLPLTDDEENILRARVIENCKIIAPLHTSLTVKIEQTIESLEFLPAYVTSGSFSFIEQPSEPELLSQEAEISFNNMVTNINTFQIDDEFATPFGYLSESINNTTTLIQVGEEETPLTINFYFKLVDGNNEEILFVKNRKFLSDPNIFTYEVERAQKQTTALSFNANSIALNNLVTIYPEIQNSETVFENWESIPLADSPDNYSTGKYPNDSNKYDINGNYLFEWNSQAAFEIWFKNYINSIGGEVKDRKYRLILNENMPSNTAKLFNLVNKIMGPSYNFVRPVPKPKD